MRPKWGGNIYDKLKVYEGLNTTFKQGMLFKIKYIKEKKMDKKKKPYVEVTVISPKKKKGTWVNGENIDKMKFPSYIKYKLQGRLRVGEIHRNDTNVFITDVKQSKYDVRLVAHIPLVAFIRQYEIKILKAKLIIFDEGDN